MKRLVPTILTLSATLGAALATLGVAQTAFAAATPIAGTVHNGTTNSPLAGASVQLVRPGSDGSKTVLSTTTTDAKGHFAFAAKDYGSNELLMANVPFNGFDYWAVAYDGGSKLKNVGINVNSQKVDLMAFETTNQPVALDFEVHHVAIKSNANGLACVERIVVENPSKKTFIGIGPRKISILINLPEGAQNVRLDPKITDAKLLKTDDGWGIVRPMTPVAYGARNALIIDYEMPWPSPWPWAKTIDLGRELSYPTKFFFVARETTDKNLEIAAPELSADQEAPVPIDGQTQTRIINSKGAPMMPTAAIPAGGRIEISVSRPVNPIFWAFAAMTVALCVFLPLALVKPRSKVKSSERNGAGNVNVQTFAREGVGEGQNLDSATFLPISGIGTALALSERARELVQKIADLDDLHEAGKIDNALYQEQRAEWKRQLIDTLAQNPSSDTSSSN